MVALETKYNKSGVDKIRFLDNVAASLDSPPQFMKINNAELRWGGNMYWDNIHSLWKNFTF